jgi:subtilisin family serine protease
MSQLLLKALLSIATGIACYFTISAASAQSLPATAAADAFMADKAALERGIAQSVVPNSVLVTFRAGVGRAEQDSIIAAFGGQRVRNFSLVEGLVQIRVPQNAERAVRALSANPRVEYAELDGVLNAEGTMPNDPGFTSQWGLYNTGQIVNSSAGVIGIDIRMPEAWANTVGGANCLVAVIDSGVLWTHADFAYPGGSNIWANNDVPNDLVDNDRNGFVDDSKGWDFYANDNNPTDENGHGTHVGGIIAAAGNNGVGVTGTAWTCKIMPLRFLSRTGSGATSDAIAALNYAVMEGARISNNSWGGGGYSRALSDAIAAAGLAGHVFVAAAGNSGVNIDASPSYPASYPHANIISVAAIDPSGNLASFTNTGRTSVDIAAPWVNILSTYKSGYAYLSGTSMAAPFVSGTLGLLAAQPGAATAETLINKVLSTGTPDPRYTDKISSGRLLDAGNSLAADVIKNVPATPTN